MSAKTVTIADLMGQSNVKFGTSGARGLVSDMTDEVCYAYTLGFIQYLEQAGELGGDGVIAIGGDLRASTGRIMAAVLQAVHDRGYQAASLGRLPSPAVCLHGLQQVVPTVMVTGSHIPEDRNGIKYTKREGEILKKDEAGMKEQQVSIPAGLFDPSGMLVEPPVMPPEDARARDAYLQRYLDFFEPGRLQGKKLGVYQHSAVGRDLVPAILEGLGAEVTSLGRSETFIPVDTEAIRPEDIDAARAWSAEHRFDAIVSTDGDSDRPLVADEEGNWLRGDVAGILVADYLGADAVVTPVSCNSAVEKSGRFDKVVRTRIGSPYVIEAMQQLRREGYQRVVGYEANGGFLTETPIEKDGRSLPPLPTRDAVIVHLAVITLSVERGCTIKELMAGLPRRFTYSDRLKQFPTDKSKNKIAELYQGDPDRDRRVIQEAFGGQFGRVSQIDATDGVRITFDNDEVVHLRPSGNAPEFRCYTEAESPGRARALNQSCIRIMETWR